MYQLKRIMRLNCDDLVKPQGVIYLNKNIKFVNLDEILIILF